MNVRIYTDQNINNKITELFDLLDERCLSYEVERVDAEWVGMRKVKSLPIIEIDGELIEAKKAMKKLKRG